ncbi:recombinase family protein [Desulfobotulus mexicanus]|nr:recombinase family protein [Desulfobotulus mexicanus]
MRYVTYYRVSTAKQSRSGLGMEAQQQAVKDFLQYYGGQVIAEFVEVESGTSSERPQFQAAVSHALLSGATVLVAKLDRLARDLHIITGLQKMGVRFRLCDLPDVDPLTVHLLAAVAQHEAKMISARTKAALGAAKQRGVQLGNPELAEVRNRDTGAARRCRRAKIGEWNQRILPIIAQLESEGFTSGAAIARELNARGLQSQQGRFFDRAAISRIRRTAGKNMQPSKYMEDYHASTYFGR